MAHNLMSHPKEREVTTELGQVGWGETLENSICPLQADATSGAHRSVPRCPAYCSPTTSALKVLKAHLILPVSQGWGVSD